MLDAWRYDLNGCSPNEISFKSNKKCYFHCGNINHKPRSFILCNLTSIKCKVSKDNFCIGCKSVGEYIHNNYPDINIDEIWSDKNDCSPYDVSDGSTKKIWLRCLSNKTHPDYDINAYNIKNSINCPYCASKRLCATNTLGYEYPEVFSIWSDKNNKTPFEYTSYSNKVVYIKCPTGKHDDYKRKICAHVLYGFRCPQCSIEDATRPKGSDSPNWNPNLSEDRRMRKSKEYADWRTAVFEHDNYLCQCCGNLKHNRLNAHHILSFSKHENLRLDVRNGITMCVKCHDGTQSGSFHNIYGTRNCTPEDLEKYINKIRVENNICIPFSLVEYHKGINILQRS